MENHYRKLLSSDLDHCKPLMSNQQIGGLMSFLADRFSERTEDDGTEKKMGIAFDLEQLQIVDYRIFKPLNKCQIELIEKLNNESPINPQDITYLCLNSLISLSWPEPKSNDELLKVLEQNSIFQWALKEFAFDGAKGLSGKNPLFPYWGRLGFLNVLSMLPPESIQSYSLDKIGVTLLKRPGLNATTYSVSDGSVIGLNFALQPILKILNRFTVHYFSSHHLAGIRRLERAWMEFAPTVMYFWGGIEEFGSSPFGHPLAFSDDSIALAHRLTTDQVEFIVGHELGHIVHDHPKRMQSLGTEKSLSANCIRHEFEFVADDFSSSLFRSRLFNELRYFTNPNIDQSDGARPVNSSDWLSPYIQHIEAKILLFIYMKFIDDCGKILKETLGDQLPFRSSLDSHPSPDARLSRLGCARMGDYPYSTQLIEYASDFFSQILEYVKDQSADQVAAIARPYLRT